MSDKIPDDIRDQLAPGFIIIPGPPKPSEVRECAYIGLRGATERLLMVLQYRSDHNYETAMQAVERAMAEYRRSYGDQ